jgi:hypothetical protein
MLALCTVARMTQAHTCKLSVLVLKVSIGTEMHHGETNWTGEGWSGPGRVYDP